MKTYLDMDEILRHRRRYIGQEYDEPYLVSAVPEEVIRSLPPADVAPVRHGQWIFKCDDQPISNDKVYGCSLCDDKNRRYYEWQLSNYCPNCGAKMDGGQDND